jgi:hypothetical protein
VLIFQNFPDKQTYCLRTGYARPTAKPVQPAECYSVNHDGGLYHGSSVITNAGTMIFCEFFATGWNFSSKRYSILHYR